MEAQPRQGPGPRHYGTRYCASARAASKYKVLYDLLSPDDGVVGAVTVEAEGNVYAATGNGGTGKDCGEYGCGLIFELSPQPGGKWAYSLVHDFTGGDDGAIPNGNLVVDASSNLWGASVSGGARTGGTVFEFTPGAGGWSETVLYSFCAQQGCVHSPSAGIIMDPSGNLYGTAWEAAFEISPVSGHSKETTLHRFGIRKGDGLDPFARLILDAPGNLYGTTSYGGGEGCAEEGGCGTVYELTPEAGGKWKETVLHRFDNDGDGVEPGGGALFMDNVGNLYGTTAEGGVTWCGEVTCGTVFELAPTPGGRWKETLLYEFKGGAGGYFPYAGVVMDKAGNLYGATVYGGGPNGCGVLYRLAPGPKDKWKYTVLHTFGRVGDGCLPSGNLAIDNNGNLYGGAIFGGTHGNGVVFELTP